MSQFVFFQSLPTDGAHGAKFFVSRNNHLYLAVANFGSRHDKRYTAQSRVYLFGSTAPECITSVSPSSGNTDGSECSGTSETFEQLQGEVPTMGATDWEHFSMEGADFLAVSEEGDLGRGAASAHGSQVFRLVE